MQIRPTNGDTQKSSTWNSKNGEAGDKTPSEDEVEGKSKDDDIEPIAFYKMFKYATSANKVMYFIGILAAVATGLTTLTTSLVIGGLAKHLTDYAAEIGDYAGDSQIRSVKLMDAVRMFALRYVISGAVMLVGSYTSVTLFDYAAHAQILSIRSRLLRSVLHQDMAWYDCNRSGEVTSRMNEDLPKIEAGLGEKVVIFIHFVVAFVGFICLTLVKGWQLALVCLCSLPITFIVTVLVSVITAKFAKKELSVYASASIIAQEAFSGIRTVKAFEGENKETKAYMDHMKDARDLNIKRNLFAGTGFGLLGFCSYTVYALSFWYGVGLVLKNKNGDAYYANYDVGTMITIFYSITLGSMMISLTYPFIEAFGIAKGACAKVFKLIDQIPTINAIGSVGHRPNNHFTHIEFRDIDFSYPTRKEVQILDKFNLRINRGQTVALVGSSGCGKSTCIQLMQRFYDPEGGKVLFNDMDLKEIDITWLRERIGVVGQEPILFGTTIYENIRYGREDATKEQIEAAARAANAINFINKLPKGFHTLVGERGAQLSGGQKQRIAIARALVRDPEILLLDEATSALDTASEAKVQAALEKASEGRTTIIVAHRLSTIRRADRIVVINKGKLVESGTHKELMLGKQHYYNLVTTQLGDDANAVNTPGEGENNLFANVKDEDEEEIKISKDETLEEVDVTEKKDSFSIFSILKMNSKEWPQILCGCITSGITGAALPVFAVLFGSIIQVLAVKDNDAYVRSQTDTFSLYFLICGIVIGLSTFLQIYTLGIAGERLTERLRGLMFETILKMDISWFDDRANGTGNLCARLSGDTSAVQGATGQCIGIIFQSLTTLVLAVSLALYYEWSLGLLALAFTPFIFMAMYMQRKVMAQKNLSTAKTMERCTKLTVEVVSNIRTVASLGSEEMFHKQYMEMLYPAVEKAKRNTHFRGLVFGLARTMIFFGFGACIYYGGWRVINKSMDLGKVFKVPQALIMGTVSIANAFAFATNLQKGISAAEGVFKLITRQSKIVNRDGVSHAPWTAEGNVSLNKVKFSYPTRTEATVLRGMSLAIAKGQKIALVGPSGCGKSTCIQLLQRFYDVDDGSANIDNFDIRDLAISNLHKQLGIVSQEPILFDRSIRDNIAYGDNSRLVSEPEIMEAAKKANIHNFVSTLPLGYETRIGEKGMQLSVGQKQRIAIARALIRNPKILLLDEATSALDAESEKVVQDALAVASEGRTSISIAHRLSTIVDCDVIFVFDEGKVCEFGTHKQLLELRGLYYTLYKLQTGGSQ